MLSVVYFVDFIFSLLLMLVSLQRPPEIEISDQQVKDLEEDELPIYSILCPLYKEWEVLGQFVKDY